MAETYYCPKNKNELEVSKENFNLCKACDSASLLETQVISLSELSDLKKKTIKEVSESRKQTIGESIICQYQNRNISIPNPYSGTLKMLFSAGIVPLHQEALASDDINNFLFPELYEKKPVLKNS